MIRLCLCLFLLLPFAARAETLDYSDFARIPILHEGRIKPLDSFARVALKRFYGAPALPGQDADAWQASVLFDPEKAANEPLFTIDHPSVQRMLNLEPRHDPVYSFAELMPVLAGRDTYFQSLLQKDKKNMSADEQELAKLYVNVTDFSQLAESLLLLAPEDVPAPLRAHFGLAPGTPLSYPDLFPVRERLRGEVKAVVARKQDHLERYDALELDEAKLSFRLDSLDESGRRNTLLRVIPPFWTQDGNWLSPWQVLESGMGSPASAEQFRRWTALGNAYRAGDAEGWQRASSALSHPPGARIWALWLETRYQMLNPLRLALMLYLLAVFSAGAGLFFAKNKPARLAYGLVALALLVHGAAILMRMAIMMRPPVSTLYESMLFVSFVSAFFGLWLERGRRQADGILAASIVAAGLLIAANVFAADSDTLEVLVAVLNTNFWLATHVVCITTGYGSSLMAGLIAHLYLIRRASGADAEALAVLTRRTHLVGLAALVFTATGTMLGGIWADQSWGRFWGWDPKENGALLIVLWLIWLLHGRVAGQLRPLGFALGMAFITIVVALAWVGVNLLSVGLHSYGFTDIAANGLMGFCAFETLLLLSLYAIIRYREKERYA